MGRVADRHKLFLHHHLSNLMKNLKMLGQTSMI